MTQVQETVVVLPEPIWWRDLRFEPASPQEGETERYVLSDCRAEWWLRGASLATGKHGQWVAQFPGSTYCVGWEPYATLDEACWKLVESLRYRLGITLDRLEVT